MKEIFLLTVPAVIAFALVGSCVFLTVYHPERELPPFMVNALATILGYYFGIGTGRP